MAYKKGVIYKTHFAAKLMQVFCIAAFHIIMNFDRDDRGLCFLRCKRNCNFL